MGLIRGPERVGLDWAGAVSGEERPEGRKVGER
jgi:hypothetical protein